MFHQNFVAVSTREANAEMTTSIACKAKNVISKLVASAKHSGEC